MPALLAKHFSDASMRSLGVITLAVIGGNLSQSHCERIVSAANIIMTDGRTLLGDQMLESLTLLRMNRDYMADAKKRHGQRYHGVMLDRRHM